MKFETTVLILDTPTLNGMVYKSETFKPSTKAIPIYKSLDNNDIMGWATFKRIGKNKEVIFEFDLDLDYEKKSEVNDSEFIHFNYAITGIPGLLPALIGEKL